MLITSVGPQVLFLIIQGTGVSLNMALNYGAKNAPPHHLAQANANCQLPSDLLKENQAARKLSISYLKKPINLWDSSNTLT